MNKDQLLEAIHKAASQTLDALDDKTLRSWLENPNLVVHHIQTTLKQDPLPYTFPVLVNYDRLLEDSTIRRANALSSSDFPTELHGIHIVHVKLTKYGFPISPETARSLIFGRGQRPAYAHEVLALAETWPDYITDKRPIVAMGQPGLDAILFLSGGPIPYAEMFRVPDTYNDMIYFASVSLQPNPQESGAQSSRGVNHPFD